MERSLLAMTSAWLAPARWTSTSSPLTLNNATYPSVLEYTAVGFLQSYDIYIFFCIAFHLVFYFRISLHTVNEMRIIPYSNSSRVTEFSQEIMKTQGEWEFLHLTVSNSTHTHENRSWDVLTYTVCNTYMTPAKTTM